ncbi:hypothetical protein F4703DRAFT_1866046 [Phycomyces blakesleeanus]
MASRSTGPLLQTTGQHQGYHGTSAYGILPIQTLGVLKSSGASTFEDLSDAKGSQNLESCPKECPETCVYPMNVDCPYIHQPSCPQEEPIAIDPSYSCQAIDGFPLPTTPIEPTREREILCPLVFFECPNECADDCIRPAVPCPFAVPATCPEKGSPTSMDIEPTLSEEHYLCPHYMIACPECDTNSVCTRATTGHCPNTNVPYCVEIATPVDNQPSIGF